MGIKLTKNNFVGNGEVPYIIAELGSNHNGDMEIAKKLILEAKSAGADCVKFQSWSKDTIFSRKKYEDNYFIADDYRNRDDYTLEKIVEKYSISESELLEMKKFSEEVGIECTSTPFSKKEADFLIDEMDSPFIKVASMDLNNYPFLEYLAKKNRPIILSTGLSELYEIDKAINTIENAGNKQIIILHCVATYPPSDSDIHLNNIKTLMKLYPEYPVGFSDHSLGIAIPLASVAFGVCLIEKHFTLDKNMEGWDHKVSATKDELKEIVQSSKRICNAIGSYRIKATETSEKKVEFRRSIVAAKKLLKGDVLTEDMIDYKRPGSGLSPEFSQILIGKKLVKDLDYDELVLFESVK